MVSTRHHPRAFPPPPETASPPGTVARRSPPTSTSTTSSSKPTPDSPPPSTRRATSRKRKSILPVKTDEDEIKEITEDAEKLAEDPSSATNIAVTTRSQTTTVARTRSPRPSRAKTTGKSVGSYQHTPSPFLIPWLLISLPLVIWDTGYVLGRPHTMPGGSVHDYLWKPYALYSTVDYFYGFPAWDNKDGFTAAQGTLNVIETAMYIYYLAILGTRVASGDGFVRGVALKSVNVFARRDSNDQDKIVIRGGTEVATAVLVCFASAVMTLSKTVLYWLNEYFSGFGHIGHNSWSALIWLWVIPNGAWLVGSSYMSWVLGKEIIERLAPVKSGRDAKREA